MTYINNVVDFCIICHICCCKYCPSFCWSCDRYWYCSWLYFKRCWQCLSIKLIRQIILPLLILFISLPLSLSLSLHQSLFITPIFLHFPFYCLSISILSFLPFCYILPSYIPFLLSFSVYFTFDFSLNKKEKKFLYLLFSCRFKLHNILFIFLRIS